MPFSAWPRPPEALRRDSGESTVQKRPWCFVLLAGASLAVPVGCRTDGGAAASLPSASAAISSPSPGLAPDLAARVLAKVGDRTITVADYVAVLDGMDRLERVRYQTPDRRKQLLDEIVDVELLAREAERRGLADRPETKETVRQILRDQVYADLRDKQPPLESIPAGDVRSYYEAHRADFKEPERRRISHIVLGDQTTAERVLSEARGTTPKQWGDLVRKSSLDKPPPEIPDELAGDLGLVTPPAFGKNDNLRAAEPLRAAAFEMDKVGDVLPHVVAAPGGFHVLRLTGNNAARDRSLEEADRTIRVLIAQERLHRAEAELDKELRAKFPVKIDEAALAKVTVPPGDKK